MGSAEAGGTWGMSSSSLPGNAGAVRHGGWSSSGNAEARVWGTWAQMMMSSSSSCDGAGGRGECCHCSCLVVVGLGDVRDIIVVII